MKPTIDSTSFGSITIEGKKYPHDVYISTVGQISKRKKKLSKKLYGTSHRISEEEINHILEENVEGIVIGTGQYGRADLSDPASALMKSRGIEVLLQPTPQAIKIWNKREGMIIGLFHVTC
jgi:hypothetical protein